MGLDTNRLIYCDLVPKTQSTQSMAELLKFLSDIFFPIIITEDGRLVGGVLKKYKVLPFCL